MWFKILWIWNISLTFWETVTLRSDSKFTLCGNLVTMALLAEKETSQRHMEPRQKPAPAVSTESQHSLSNPNHQFCVCEIQLVNGYLLLCSSLSCKWNTSWKMQLLYIFNKGAERHITSIFWTISRTSEKIPFLKYFHEPIWELLYMVCVLLLIKYYITWI